MHETLSEDFEEKKYIFIYKQTILGAFFYSDCFFSFRFCFSYVRNTCRIISEFFGAILQSWEYWVSFQKILLADSFFGFLRP